MRDDVDRVQLFVPSQRRSHLRRRRLTAIEQDGLDPRPHVAQNSLEIGDRRIHKENFRGTGHDWLLFASNSFQKGNRPPA
ncbi:hypothetical protein A9K71_29465 [Mesorhizobium sp. WSM3873]|nr:hypothetical protein A9K71_29465 [Mesorhizobium sp. WSM3873]